MGYFDLWKKRQTLDGNNITESTANNGKYQITSCFKQDPSYRLATLQKRDLTENPLDVRLKNNPNKTTEKTFDLLPDTAINIGDYIQYDTPAKTFIVEEFEDNNLSPFAEGFLCEQNLMWKDENGTIRNYKCDKTSNSYGSKINTSNGFISEIDSKADVRVQHNEHTIKIPKDFRFIFSPDEDDIYKVINKEVSIGKGILKFTLEKDALIAEDDLDMCIAFNNYNIDPAPPPTEYTIIGDDTIKINQIKTYKLEAFKTGILFEVDSDVCEIVSQLDGVCEVKCLVKDEYCELMAMDGVNILCSKSIETVR